MTDSRIALAMVEEIQAVLSNRDDFMPSPERDADTLDQIAQVVNTAHGLVEKNDRT